MKKSTLISSFLLLAGIAPVAAQNPLPRPVVVSPRVENLTNPGGIETLQPRLSWQITSTGRAIMQTKYRILVADDQSKLNLATGNMWDTQVVPSEQSLWIPYGGKPLEAGKTYLFGNVVHLLPAKPHFFNQVHFCKPVLSYNKRSLFFTLFCEL